MKDIIKNDFVYVHVSHKILLYVSSYLIPLLLSVELKPISTIYT